MGSAQDFIRCALASGLVVQSDLDEALQALAAEQKKKPTDKRLAAKLVELEHINSWQSEQLLAGRSKFNLGPYQVVDAIGQGGMGHVFKAEHTIMGRIVAVKVLPKAKSTPDAVTNFHREVRTQAQLDHENLVRAHDAGHDGNVHFLVTEYVPGTDLRKLVRHGGKLSMPAAALIITQAARGLEYAHSKGLVHRDIKPGNILVTPEGRTKVSDLGLAAFFTTEPDPDDPRRNKIVGTADYLAPEQILNPGSSTAASDIYSLGCTLYYAVTGKVPFPGGTTKEKARRHCTEEPLDPRRLNPDISPEFADVINRMMKKDAAQRPQTASEVIDLLSAWVDESSPVVLQAVGAVTAKTRGKKSTARLPQPGETEATFLVQPRHDPSGDESESSSQSSQSTHPFAADETAPVFAEMQSYSDLPGTLQTMILIGSVTALLGLAAAIAVSLF